MPGDTSAFGGTEDATIDSAVQSNFASVSMQALRQYQDGEQKARHSWARLQDSFDFFATQATGVFLQGIADSSLAQLILGQRAVQAQPQVGSLWAGATPGSPNPVSGGGAMPTHA